MANYVGKLQEILNKNHELSPVYIDNNIDTNDKKTIKVKYTYNKINCSADGEASNKKEAKQIAAKIGLCRLYYLMNDKDKCLNLPPNYFNLNNNDLAIYDTNKSNHNKLTCDNENTLNHKLINIITNNINSLNQTRSEKNPFIVDDMSSCSSSSSIAPKKNQKKNSKKDQQFNSKNDQQKNSKRELQPEKQNTSTTLSNKQNTSTPLSNKQNSNSSSNKQTNNFKPSNLSSNWRESNDESRKPVNSKDDLYARAPNKTNGFTLRKSSPLKRLDDEDDIKTDGIKYLKLKDFTTKRHNDESKMCLDKSTKQYDQSISLNESKMSLNKSTASLNESTSSTGTEILNKADEIKNLRKLDLKSQLDKISQLNIFKNDDNLTEVKKLKNIDDNVKAIMKKNRIPINNHYSEEPVDFHTYLFNNTDLIKKIIEDDSNKTNKKIIDKLIIQLPMIEFISKCNNDILNKKKKYAIQLIYGKECYLSASYLCNYDDEDGEEICSKRLIKCIKINIKN